MKVQPKLIALDWGTSSLRAYLLGCNGEILDTRESACGILNVPNGDFLETYLHTCGQWLEQYRLPALASGMIGSRQGWQEAPYVEAPATAAILANQLTRLSLGNGLSFYIVPGVTCKNDEGNPEIMRGEETQILGADDVNGAVFVLPGTHSKWVNSNLAGIGKFSTFMTGELFAVLKKHSILGRLMPETDTSEIDDAFRQGVRASQQSKTGNLLNHLFSVRTLALFERIETSKLASYLSGMLIGEEIREAVNMGFSVAGIDQPLRVIGETHLVDRYCAAFDIYKLKAQSIPSQVVVKGLWKIFLASNLVNQHEHA